MIQQQRHPWARPGAVLGVAALVTSGLVTLSFIVQPPSASEGDTLLGSLAWGRSLVFSIGIVGFVVGLAWFTNADDAPAQPQTPIMPKPRTLGADDVYMVVAFGTSVEDSRAIDEASDAAAAIGLVQTWQSMRPAERIVVYGPDGRILAYRRPARPTARTRRRRAA